VGGTAVTIIRPEVQYAKSGDVSIAFQVVGDGPATTVLVQGFLSHLDMAWEEPSQALFLRRLASRARLVLFDKRGTGLSDPFTPESTTLDRVNDIGAVMDAAEVERATVFGISEGAALSTLFSARHPERVDSLILFGGFARLLYDRDYPWGWTEQRLWEYVEENWFGENANPSVAHDPGLQEWVRKYFRSAASPAMLRSLMEVNARIDIRDCLADVAVPTLVLAREQDDVVSPENGRFLASKIPNAKYVEIPGVDHTPWFGDMRSVFTEIERFLAPESVPRKFTKELMPLTPREREVLGLAACGASARTIANRLFISERTAESHVASAYTKLGIRSRAELNTRAKELGLLTDP
jgi:pimeloyl-ACP methyl ester carboxylesterase/DNA-binding CsgD family transcriptional regulator